MLSIPIDIAEQFLAPVQAEIELLPHHTDRSLWLVSTRDRCPGLPGIVMQATYTPY